MRRDPIKLYFKDPDRKAKLFLFSTFAMITTTVLMVVGTLIFILNVFGII